MQTDAPLSFVPTFAVDVAPKELPQSAIQVDKTSLEHTSVATQTREQPGPRSFVDCAVQTLPEAETALRYYPRLMGVSTEYAPERQPSHVDVQSLSSISAQSQKPVQSADPRSSLDSATGFAGMPFKGPSEDTVSSMGPVDSPPLPSGGRNAELRPPPPSSVLPSHSLKLQYRQWGVILSTLFLLTDRPSDPSADFDGEDELGLTDSPPQSTPGMLESESQGMAPRSTKRRRTGFNEFVSTGSDIDLNEEFDVEEFAGSADVMVSVL
jgi:hypothetical protein